MYCCHMIGLLDNCMNKCTGVLNKVISESIQSIYNVYVGNHSFIVIV